MVNVETNPLDFNIIGYLKHNFHQLGKTKEPEKVINVEN